MVTVTFSRKEPPIGAVITCNVAGVAYQWCNETQLVLDDCVSLTTSQSISRHVARLHPDHNLYPSHILHRTQVDHWLSVSSSLVFGSGLSSVLKQLEVALALAHCLVPPHTTVADYELFASLYRNSEWHNLVASDAAPQHVLRWYNSMLMQVSSILSSLPQDVSAVAAAAAAAVVASTSVVLAATPVAPAPVLAAAVAAVSSGDKGRGIASSMNKGKREDGGRFVELPDAREGEVVVRFPPEASGYLHIGHAKAALLNQHYQKAFKGQLIMRFDDTNPAKENAHFEKVILEDLKLLEVAPDRFTHTSDYFDLMLQLCENLIKKELAFVDDTDAETMKAERDERKESKNRNNSVEQNLAMWEEMKKGSTAGQQCAVRAKIDMNSNNGCMRDPTIYRCKPEPHVRTGTNYKVYPTYDFACPIVDSIEGVTHALRTTEYHDRDDQFFWFLEKLELRKLHIYEYSRLNMNNTVLSKRKLTWFVEQGLVDGWDDPRFPTVRGILRRGLTVQGLKEFIVAQGSSRSVVNMEWDKIWSFNKKVIDAIAPRYVALDRSDLIPIHVGGAVEQATSAQKHPKDASLGTKTVWVGPKVFIETVDAEELKEGENATFINWGNLLIKKISRENGKVTSVDADLNLGNTDYKKTLKLTWLADCTQAPLTPVVAVYFDHLISKGVLGKDEDFKNFIGHETRSEVAMLGDDELKQLTVGDIIQIQRKGFFRVDEQYRVASLSSCKESPVVLFSIPDGHSKDTAVVATKKTLSEKETIQSVKGKMAEKSPQEELKPIVNGTANAVQELHGQIKAQGDKIRQLKVDKADKNVVLSEVTILKELKVKFMAASGVEWTPDIDMKQFGDAAKPPAATAAHDDASKIHQQIVDQGDTVRKLKANNANKSEVTAAVEILLSLKKQFKESVGLNWSPSIDVGQVEAQSSNPPAVLTAGCVQPSARNIINLHQKIVDQGNNVRNLKSQKAEKSAVTAAVNILLSLKKDFKDASKIDWTPNIDLANFNVTVDAASVATVLPAPSPASAALASIPPPTVSVPAPSASVAAPSADVSAVDINAGTIHDKIVEQGNKVRNLKSEKADKKDVKTAVDVLLQLKQSFKEITNVDWKPDIDMSQFSTAPPVSASPTSASPTSASPTSASPTSASPTSASPTPASATSASSGSASLFEELNIKVKAQGDKVRQLKSSGADKALVSSEVAELLKCKKEFKEALGVDWKPDMSSPQSLAAVTPQSVSQTAPSAKAKPAKKQHVIEEAKADDGKKQTRLGLEVTKEENLSEWYSQVITKSDMIEYYNVSGCYILRPWSYSIWESIKAFIDAEIKKLGVENSYFPIFVSRDALEKEKTHIADFSPEVAWVTKSGSTDLAEPIAIRPTSETVMYPAFAKWIQSHRDLPLRLNQWNNVVRWEFKQPTPFLRTREFLWQEGHTAFATQAEATTEVYQILDIYARTYEDLLAIPVIKGKKTEKEKFAGGDFTTTTEAYISGSGRGIQGATSHHLGQNFSKMFDIIFEDPVTQEKQFVYQNSWGLTTRTIGVLVMVHGDNKGLVLPPKVASVQAIIMAVGITAKATDEEKASLYAACRTLEGELNEGGIRTKTDLRDNVTPAWKFNHWELKGVPLRLELGPREVASGQVFVVRRDNGQKQGVQRGDVVGSIAKILDTIQADMFQRAKSDMDFHKKLVMSWNEFCLTLDDGNIILAPFCGEEACEDSIKKDSARDRDSDAGAPSMGAKSLCIPFQQPQPLPAGTPCIHPGCGKPGQYYVLFGRSY